MRLWALRTMALCILLGSYSSVTADELRPAYIQLDEVQSGEWRVVWKVSENSRLGRNGRLILPANCDLVDNRNPEREAGNLLFRGTLKCNGQVQGQQIGLAGLEATNTDALVRVAPLASELITLRLTAQAPSAEIPSVTAGVVNNVVLTYTVIGIEHILFGFDHLLFVLSLVLLLSGWQRIAWAVTAFTVSHSITLVGTTFGWFALPTRPVEAVIALSIVFLAAEILKREPGQPRLSEQYPWLVAFVFGLLHGFGFAGALAEIGLPTSDRPLALFSFNIGVEVGQLIIVAIALLVLHQLDRLLRKPSPWIRIVPAYFIGTMATYWFIERLGLF